MTNLAEILYTNGISTDILTLLIFIPIVATLVNFFRYILGIKTLGIYPALILGFAYYLSGARYGIIITIVVILVTLINYTILKKIRMHYISRVTINYFMLAIILTFLYFLLYNIPMTQINIDFSQVNPIAIVLIATLSDFVLKTYDKKDLFGTIIAFGETMVIASLGWMIIRYEAISTYIINNLWILLVLLLINFLIGKYINLRLMDLFRFKQLLKEKPQISDVEKEKK